MRSVASNWTSLIAFAAAFPVEDFALTPAERQLFLALNSKDVRYILLGMGAAPLEGAPVATQDLDVSHGLDGFDVEYARSPVRSVEGVEFHVLPLERIIASKRVTQRHKDLAQLPILEATLLARKSEG